MPYVLGFDPTYTLTQYLDWLNQGECKFPLDQKTPWVNDPSFEVVVSLEESQESKLSDYFFCGSLTIVSKKFKEVLSKFSSKLEFVPISLLCGEKELNFYALHVMEQLDAVDVDNSEFAGVKYGMVAGVTKLTLKSESVKGRDIFMLQNTFTPIIIVSDQVVEEAKKLDLKGASFTPTQDYKEDTRGI